MRPNLLTQKSTNQAPCSVFIYCNNAPPPVWLLTAWPGGPGFPGTPSLPGIPCKKELRLNWFSLWPQSGHLLLQRGRGKVAKAPDPLLVCVPARSRHLHFFLPFSVYFLISALLRLGKSTQHQVKDHSVLTVRLCRRKIASLSG